jgi:hypothetical protein
MGIAYSVTGTKNRWYYYMPVYRVINDTFPRLLPFFRGLTDPSPTAQSIKTLLEFPAHSNLIRIELATVVHIGGELERVTTLLEGDGVLIFTAWSTLMEMKAVIDGPLPQPVCDLISDLYPQNDRAAKISSCELLYSPCSTYFTEQIAKFALSFHAIRLASLWHPLIANTMSDEAIIALLRHANTAKLAWFKAERIAKLIVELPKYRAHFSAAEGRVSDFVQFNCSFQYNIPQFSAGRAQILQAASRLSSGMERLRADVRSLAAQQRSHRARLVNFREFL